MRRSIKAIGAAAAFAAALITAANAAETVTYNCRDHGKDYPTTIIYPADPDADGEFVLTWRGTAYRNLKIVEGCRAAFGGTDNGTTVRLCTATQGYADLTIGKQTFDCRIKLP